MKWIRENYKGEKVVWYSGDVIEKIKEIAKHCMKQDICTLCKYSNNCYVACTSENGLEYDNNKRILEIIDNEDK